MNRSDIVNWMDDNPENVCCPYANESGFTVCRSIHNHSHAGLNINADDKRCPVCGSGFSEYLVPMRCCPNASIIKFKCGSSFSVSTTGPESTRSFVNVHMLSPTCGIPDNQDII